MDNSLAIVIAVLAVLGFSIGVASDLRSSTEKTSKDTDQPKTTGGKGKTRKKL